MTRSAGCELLTIGHSNLMAHRFVALLKHAGVTAIADVRSVPFSRWCPWFSGKTLAERLAREAIAYIALGDALGGRPRDPRLYRDGVADYEAMAARAEDRKSTRLNSSQPSSSYAVFCLKKKTTWRPKPISSPSPTQCESPSATLTRT